MDSKNHAIWDLYNTYKTARLNMYYYESKVKSLKRRNFSIELVLAISVSSGVLGLWFWNTSIGSVVWKILVTLAAFLGVIKPLIKIADQINQMSETVISWRGVHEKLKKLTVLIKMYDRYSAEEKSDFKNILDEISFITKKEPIGDSDKRLNEQCFNQVNQELPIEEFYIPGG